jgi:hypothetical protein
LNELLSGYSCSLNSDIEGFLRNNAAEFSRRFLSKTYLVHEANSLAILGYFTLTPKSIVIKEENALSKTFLKKLDKFLNREGGVVMMSVILLAQLGKNYGYGGGAKISGSDLLLASKKITSAVQKYIGGRVVCVECEDAPKLRHFYETNGFVHLQDRKTTDGSVLIQYLKYIKGEEQ